MHVRLARCRYIDTFKSTPEKNPPQSIDVSLYHKVGYNAVDPGHTFLIIIILFISYIIVQQQDVVCQKKHPPIWGTDLSVLSQIAPILKLVSGRKTRVLSVKKMSRKISYCKNTRHRPFEKRCLRSHTHPKQCYMKIMQSSVFTNVSGS